MKGGTRWAGLGRVGAGWAALGRRGVWGSGDWAVGRAVRRGAQGHARRRARQRGPPTHCHRCGRDSGRTSTPSPRATSQWPLSRATSAETQRRARRQTACAPAHPGAPPSTLTLALTLTTDPNLNPHNPTRTPPAPLPRCFTTDPSVRQEECAVCDADPSLLEPVTAPHEHTPVPDWVHSTYGHSRCRHSHSQPRTSPPLARPVPRLYSLPLAPHGPTYLRLYALGGPLLLDLRGARAARCRPLRCCDGGVARRV
jgi:hypothetical protein